MIGHGDEGSPGEVSQSSVSTFDRKVQPRKKSLNKDFQSKIDELDIIEAKQATINNPCISRL